MPRERTFGPFDLIKEMHKINDAVFTIKRIKKKAEWGLEDTKKIALAIASLNDKLIEEFTCIGNRPGRWFATDGLFDTKKQLTEIRDMLRHCGKVEVSGRLTPYQLDRVIEYYSETMPDSMKKFELTKVKLAGLWKRNVAQSTNDSITLGPKLKLLIKEINTHLRKIHKLSEDKTNKNKYQK